MLEESMFVLELKNAGPGLTWSMFQGSCKALD